jgi:hypothetical protein
MTRTLVLALALFSAGCATEYVVDDHDPFDFDVPPPDGKADGVPAIFDVNNVLADEVLTASDAMDVDAVQAFFEHTPYGNPSWLASAQFNGVSAAQLVVDAARAEGIHPLVLVARMQTETSLVSKTAAPSQSLQNRALGCGCSDGGACSLTDRGLPHQIACGAHVLHAMFDGSVDGTGEWRRGHTTRTFDPRSVTPATHATAAMYAYTPWVLQGTGGTWLAWNITRKYMLFAEAAGLVR